MVTTIQVSEELLENLKKMKIHEKESYEDIILDLIEDRLELSEETKKEIEESRKDAREGRLHKWEDIKRELKLNV
jgi:predicted CopG family antitoxin